MNPNLKPSDKATVLAKIDPVSQGVGAVSTGWLLASTHHQYLAALIVGVLGAAATVDAKLEQATSGAGAGAKDVTGSAITQLTKAGADDNKAVLINLNPNKLDVANDFDYFRLTVTVAVAASLLSACVLGFEAREGVAAHIAGVDEIVTV